MLLTFIPQFRTAPLVYEPMGDVLDVSGRPYDFGALAEGDTLPRGAVRGNWLLSDVTRTGGEIVLTVAAPNHVEGWTLEPGDPGIIDWTQVRSAVQRSDASLSAWRAQASLPVVDFAIAALDAGLISAAEAEAWVARNGLPAIVEAAFASLPQAEQIPTRLRAIGSATVRRDHPIVAMLADHMGMTGAQVDALFGDPPP